MNILSQEELLSQPEREKLDQLELSLIDAVLERRDPDKLYQLKIEPYVEDPVRFAREVISMEPTDEQVKMLTAISEDDHVSARSGRGIGKTTGLSMVIWWYMVTRPHCRIPCTAPTENQLRDVLWAELNKQHRDMEPYFAEKFELTTDRIFHVEHKATWFSVARTARKEASESFQGFHEENMMFVVDEASGVPDEIFDVMEGAMTDVGNKALLVGNPTRTHGYFHSTHHEYADKPWKVFHFSSEESELVKKNQQWLENMADRPGGKTSNFYRVHVLGEFPIEDDSTVIPLPWVQAAVDRQIEYHKPLSNRAVDSVGVDIAAGGDNDTVFCFLKGVRVIGLVAYEKEESMKAAGRIAGLTRRGPETRKYKGRRRPIPPELIRIDVCGVGIGVYERLMEQGLDVMGIDVREATSDPTLYVNKRSELYWQLREYFESGMISIPNDKILIRELASIKYELDSRGRILIWSKQRMKKEGIKSPDRAEALMLAFADYYPEIEKTKPKTWQQKWIEKTEEKPQQDPWVDYAKKVMREDHNKVLYFDDEYSEPFQW